MTDKTLTCVHLILLQAQTFKCQAATGIAQMPRLRNSITWQTSLTFMSLIRQGPWKKSVKRPDYRQLRSKASNAQAGAIVYEQGVLVLHAADPDTILSPKHCQENSLSTEPGVNPEYCQVWSQCKIRQKKNS